MADAKHKTAADLLAAAFGTPADVGVALPNHVAGSVGWMVQPIAGMAALSAMGFGMASQMLGLWADALSVAAGKSPQPIGSASADLAEQKAPPAQSAVVTSFADARAAAGRLARGEVVAGSSQSAPAKVAPVAADADNSVSRQVAEPKQVVGSSSKSGGKTGVTKLPRAAKSPAISSVSTKESLPAANSTKPAALERPEAPDDLKAITGIGPKLEQVLNGFGIWTYAQIAGWTAAEIAWVDDKLGFGGRIGRDGWTTQAAALGTGKAKV